jgi:uncharacterized membrane protein
MHFLFPPCCLLLRRTKSYYYMQHLFYGTTSGRRKKKEISFCKHALALLIVYNFIRVIQKQSTRLSDQILLLLFLYHQIPLIYYTILLLKIILKQGIILHSKARHFKHPLYTPISCSFTMPSLSSL